MRSGSSLTLLDGECVRAVAVAPGGSFARRTRAAARVSPILVCSDEMRARVWASSRGMLVSPSNALRNAACWGATFAMRSFRAIWCAQVSRSDCAERRARARNRAPVAKLVSHDVLVPRNKASICRSQGSSVPLSRCVCPIIHGSFLKCRKAGPWGSFAECAVRCQAEKEDVVKSESP